MIKKMYKAEIFVTLKNGVLDPQGSAIENSLQNIGISSIAKVRQGKFFELEVSESNEEDALARVTEACKKLFANMVIENYKIEIKDV